MVNSVDNKYHIKQDDTAWGVAKSRLKEKGLAVTNVSIIEEINRLAEANNCKDADDLKEKFIAGQDIILENSSDNNIAVNAAPNIVSTKNSEVSNKKQNVKNGKNPFKEGSEKELVKNENGQYVLKETDSQSGKVIAEKVYKQDGKTLDYLVNYEYSADGEARKSFTYPSGKTYNPISESNFAKLNEGKAVLIPNSREVLLTNLENQRLDQNKTLTTGKGMQGQYSLKLLNSSKYSPLIEKYAKEFGVDINVAKAMAFAESSFDPNAVSKRGSKGLLQMEDATAKAMGVKNVFDPEENIKGGLKYFASLLKKYDGDYRVALVAYNKGMGKVAREGEEASLKSSNYHRKILD